MINHMTLQGRLTRDPELRHTNAGVPVCSFTVAWSEKYKEQETKLFMPCTAWRTTGEMVSRNFFKGKEIVVEGQLSTRDRTDNEGKKRKVIELTVSRVHFCGPKSEEGGNAPDTPEPQQQDSWDLSDDGELPF